MRRSDGHRLRPAAPAALAVGLAAAAGIWSGCGGSSAPLVAVPDVRGLDVSRATARICDSGLVPRLAITRVLVPLYPTPPGGGTGASAAPAIQVARTDPAPGARVAGGSTVSVAVSVPGNVALATPARCP